jgi:hypothetical protein
LLAGEIRERLADLPAVGVDLASAGSWRKFLQNLQVNVFVTILLSTTCTRPRGLLGCS